LGALGDNAVERIPGRRSPNITNRLGLVDFNLHAAAHGGLRLPQPLQQLEHSPPSEPMNPPRKDINRGERLISLLLREVPPSNRKANTRLRFIQRVARSFKPQPRVARDRSATADRGGCCTSARQSDALIGIIEGVAAAAGAG
jgi:hypothetical protein